MIPLKERHELKIDAEEVRRIAALAHLHLSEAEIEKMPGELSRILDYIDQLVKVDVSSIREGDASPATPTRDDVEGGSIPIARIEANAPAFENGFFVVPKVIGE